MEKELIDQKNYQEIVANQTAILEELDRINLNVSTANQLSNRFIGEAYGHFKQGTEAIARIRNNLDLIHKDLAFISKMRGQPKQ